MSFKPMLAAAAPEDLSKIRLPVLVSPKLDGIRCVVHEGVAKTRMLKPIPNDYIRGLLSKPEYEGFDGEIVTYSGGVLGPLDDFNTVQGNVMRKGGTPVFRFYVFDNFTKPNTPYARRLQTVPYDPEGPVHRLECLYVSRLDGLHEAIRAYEQDGHEGTMVRCPKAPYKYGRSTAKEQGLLKIKKFFDDEASITGFEELLSNKNTATKNALGSTERSTHASGMVPQDTLGALIVRYKDVVFSIGTGFTQAQRQDLWTNRESLLGQKVTFKYQELSPAGIPRFPVFLGIRRDL
ncbi:hypothetical protein [Paracoccus sp. (in: a-proteobacteria)]|uniref:ATP-dependent DNA ligase n=1 Tax=Paracoccus sp. TaxID=267 RepID=UPI0026DFD24D|nr:hypothetical protein [Paracoccus sp. (in: a-proteobacteria)]MDO5647358.1 hypothetical protein [Paracoccus sp. (in: a-proteobacteria)]